MAKKRTVETAVEETTAMQSEDANVEEEASIENTKAPEQTEASDTRQEEEEINKDKSTNAKTEIPEYALSLLKVFNRYPELYISMGGGVYIPGTKLPVNKGSILYKNPFYNS